MSALVEESKLHASHVTHTPHTSAELHRIDEIVPSVLAHGTTALISVECFPPKTDESVVNLFKNLSTMIGMTPRPSFVDFTWGAGGSTSELTLDLCARAQTELGISANLHLTCTNMEASKVDAALASCRSKGIRNILALRGDPPAGQERWVSAEGGFTCALDLVKHIRKTHGNYFCITVAGYPEGHPDKMVLMDDTITLSPSEMHRYRTVRGINGEPDKISVCRDAAYQEELVYLKKKVDAGANCIITQMFFDPEVYGLFVSACRAIGITVPILPGIMLVNSYAGFNRMASLCKTRVPREVESALERVKDDEASLRAFAVHFGVQMSQRLVAMGAPCLHFYTLNSATLTAAIVEQLLVADSLTKKSHA